MSEQTKAEKSTEEKKIVKPYSELKTGKKEQVNKMFDAIADRYDFMNRLLSAGIDVSWRKKAIALLKSRNPKQILDVATGTGDFAIQALSLNPDKITGIDISGKMLEMGKIKIAAKNLNNKIELIQSDAENLPFEDNTFDAVTVAFGVRNFEDLEKGLTNIYKVLKYDGMAVILEFSKPHRFPVSQLYSFYFSTILPVTGRLLSKDPHAYSYLHKSVQAFPEGKAFEQIMKNTGFVDVKTYPLSFGIASIYTGVK